MTIVCAYKDIGRGEVWIGSDSRSTSGSFVLPEKAKKIYSAGKWRIGHAGNTSAGEMIQACCDEIAELDNVHGVSNFIRCLLKDNGFFQEETEYGLSNNGQQFLICSKDVISAAYPKGGVIIPSNNFTAIGVADDFAYGAAYALMEVSPYLSGDRIVKAAIKAAMFYDNTCGGDIEMECL